MTIKYKRHGDKFDPVNVRCEFNGVQITGFATGTTIDVISAPTIDWIPLGATRDQMLAQRREKSWDEAERKRKAMEKADGSEGSTPGQNSED